MAFMSHLSYPNTTNWWEHLRRPPFIHSDNFDFGIHPADLLSLTSPPINPSLAQSWQSTHPALQEGAHGPHNHYYRPWWNKIRRENEGGLSIVKPEKDSFQVVLDVKQFAPEEITVKVVDKNIVVSGEHDEKKDDHGYITRQFSRRYLIPEQCNLEKVESNLSSDGILTITVPLKEPPKIEGERIISIQHTGKPAIREKQPAESQPIEVKKDEEKK